jgi:hypothetical protein
MNIRDILDEAIKQAMNKQEIYSIVCNVDSVDTGDRTCVCTPINGGAELQDVRIQASLVGTTGLFIEPEVDSKVIVSFLSREIAYVSLFSEIKNVYLDFSDKVIFNGGLNGAMVKIGDLVGRLNDIEEKVNDIKYVSGDIKDSLKSKEVTIDSIATAKEIAEKFKKDQKEKERAEKERLEKEKADKDQKERERSEEERLEKEKADKDQKERERAEEERLLKEKTD